MFLNNVERLNLAQTIRRGIASMQQIKAICFDINKFYYTSMFLSTSFTYSFEFVLVMGSFHIRIGVTDHISATRNLVEARKHSEL
jgi:hypothetical protein